MLRLGTHIRLTVREIEHLIFITDIEPGEIRTMDDLERYISKCKRHYWGTSRDTRELHRLIDEAYHRCLKCHDLTGS
ncbi:hypothetical protein GCM10027277_26090 [Pseudoduganella ginsengisoli]|uniref:Uncharacterized protein n=1 Tax=Pseudoduganella ginsengisoli TaxID=1462440 RepID=A0A6L6Q0W3_9BURK|nr:hypothetical protein [Pseudoduganella ginsengisoli]MTW02672.1 hypothetical protein [Pseudoduganella ginsengisoli]